MSIIALATIFVSNNFLPVNAQVGAVATQVDYYTANNGVASIRSLSPFSTSTASGSGIVSQTVNPDGSVTASISNAPAYADSGFYLNAGTLGDLNSIVVRSSRDSDLFGLNIWFDKDKNGEFFVWSGNVLAGLGDDSYILGPGSRGNTLTINNATLFTSMNPGGEDYTLTQLKNGVVPGIGASTSIAIWIGVTTSDGGSASATIDSLLVTSLLPPPRRLRR